MLETERSAYPWFINIATRWMDNDVYGHVNNVTYYSYFDTAANSYLMEKGGLSYDDDVVGFVVASSCQYRSPIAFPQKLDVGVRVNTLGRSSVEYGIAIFKEGEPQAAAFGSFTHAFVSRTDNKPTEIPGRIRSALQLIMHTT